MPMRVRTASRLHFGLLSLPVPKGQAPAEAPRLWGGVGLMVRAPGIELTARPSDRWQADGPLCQRVQHFVKRFLSGVGNTYSTKLHFSVTRCAPEHQGLGTGTQLALATARQLAEHTELPDKSAPNLAQLVGRGNRSAIGIHGFDHGGFLVEAGKRLGDAVSPLIARADFPERWRVVLVFLDGQAGLHGVEEKQAFAALHEDAGQMQTLDKLCRLILMGMLPALHDEDLLDFGEALYEFNRRVGEMFQPVQGGIYAHPLSEAIVSFLRRHEIHGVGQSSWGPALFAVAADEDQAQHAAGRLREEFRLPSAAVLITQAANQGAELMLEDERGSTTAPESD